MFLCQMVVICISRIPAKYSIVNNLHQIELHAYRKALLSKYNEKMLKLSKEQDKPLLNVENTVICYNLDEASTPVCNGNTVSRSKGIPF